MPETQKFHFLFLIVFSTLCLFPYLSRISHPSLYSDDILRIADLKTKPLPKLLIRPFNEHLAPFFEFVSWSCWKLAGESLMVARWTFTLASYLPFLLCQISLGCLLRRELKSPTTALVAVAVFGLSSLSAEVVFWYSASSFSWALLFTIQAIIWGGAAAEETRRRRRNLFLTCFAAFLAPMGSGLGLLAGPLGAIRSGLSRKPAESSSRLLGVGMSILGTTAYLLFGGAVRYRATLSASLRENADFTIGLWHVARAPVMVLIPGLLGVVNLEHRVSTAFQALLTVVFWTCAILWAARSPRRPMLAVGLGLIFGGYALTYPLRVRKQASDLLDYQRYHEFPQLGISLLVACATVSLLRRFDAQPTRRLALALAFASVMLAMNLGSLRSRGNLYRFPEQARTFLAIEHLEEICRRQSISRQQAIAALEPIRTKWFPHDFNGLKLLGTTVPSPRCPDGMVRPILLDALRIDEREALFGSMEVASHVRLAAEDAQPLALSRLIDSQSIRQEAVPGSFSSPGWPACQEFEIPNPSGNSSARELAFADCLLSGPVEIWWSDGISPWSAFRSLRWRPKQTSGPRDWAIPLDAIPHFDPGSVRRLRVYFREAGPFALAPPRLTR